MAVFLYFIILAGAAFAYCFGVGLKTLENDFKRGRKLRRKRSEVKSVANEQEAVEGAEIWGVPSRSTQHDNTESTRYTAEQEDHGGDWIGAATLGVLYLTFCAAVAAAWEGDKLATATGIAIDHADEAAKVQHADTMDAIGKAGEANKNAKDFADKQIVEMQNANTITKGVAEATSKSAEAALKQAEALRGNIRLENTHFEGVMGNGDFSVDPKKLLGWRVTPHLRNVGGTDVRNFIGWWNVVIVKREPPLSHDEVMSLPCPTIEKPDTTYHPASVSPGELMALQTQELGVDHAIKAASNNNLESIYVVIHIEYNDIFADSKLHHYDLCTLMVPFDISKGDFSEFVIESRGWE